MKSTLLTIFLFTGFNFYAQTSFEKTVRTEFPNAILRECFNNDFQSACTQKKLEEIIMRQITDDLISDLPHDNKELFSLSCLFFTGKDGKVIPDFTEVRCESNQLKEATTIYINSKLPEFLPKNARYSEQRSPHIINLTFIRNPKTGRYFAAYASEISERKIKTNYITHDKAPVFPGCNESFEFSEQIECSQNKIFDLIKKSYRKPDNKAVYVNMSIYVTIDSDGKVNIDKITGSATDEYEYEVYRVVNTLPHLKPAMIKGIPSPISFNVGKLIIR